MSTDYEIHRIKWDNWTPSAIKTLTFNQESNLLAIGREDGEIEICQPSEKYYVQLRIPGQKDFNLQKLVWSSSSRVTSQSGRLFGISLRGFLFEVDLISLTFTNINDTYGGAAWCLAANPKNTILAVGCEDGNIRLFDYSQHHSLKNNLQYVRTYAGSVGNRVLSCVFHPTQEKLFFGCADGTIRCVDEKNGGSIFRVTGDFGRGLNTYIWSLCILVHQQNHNHTTSTATDDNTAMTSTTTATTLVSGDNRGHIQFWDADIGVLSQSFQQHTADILCITQGTDENQVFASGVDSKISCFQRSATTSATGGSGIWHYTTSHRPHSHDVNALCVCIPSSSLLSGSNNNSTTQSSSSSSSLLLLPAVLVSGGLDCKLCTYDLPSFSSTRPHWILPVPASGLVSSSEDYRVVAVKHKQYIDIWNVHLHNNSNHHSSNSNTSSSNSTHNKMTLLTDSTTNDDDNDEKEEMTTNNDRMPKKRGRKAKVMATVTDDDDKDEIKDTTTTILSSSSSSSSITDDNNSHYDHNNNNNNRFELKLRLNIKGSNSVATHCVSADGHWLAVTSAGTGTRLWYINNHHHHHQVANTTVVEPYLKSMILPSKVAKYVCHCLSFSTDSKRLIGVTNNGMIYIFSLQIITATTTGCNGNDDDDSKVAIVEVLNKKQKKSRKTISSSSSSATTSTTTTINHAEGDGDEHNNTTTITTNTTNTSLQPSCTSVTEINFKKTVDEYAHEYTHTTASSGTSGGSDALCYIASKVTVSADGRYLAIADSSNYGIVYIYDIDSTRLHWRLPRQQYTASSSSSSSSSSSVSKNNNKNNHGTQSSTITSATTDASYTHPVTCLLFHPSLEHSSTLFVCYTNNIFQFFNIETCLIKNWSIQNPPHQFPTCLTQKSISIENAFFHPFLHDMMILYSKNSTIFVNIGDKTVSSNETAATTTATNTKASSKKSKASTSANNNSSSSNNSSSDNLPDGMNNHCIVSHPRIIMHTDNSNKSMKIDTIDTTSSHTNHDMVIVEKFRGLVHMGFVNHNNNTHHHHHQTNQVKQTSQLPILVVIENPWIRVLEQLPDPLTRKRYGT